MFYQKLPSCLSLISLPVKLTACMDTISVSSSQQEPAVAGAIIAIITGRARREQETWSQHSPTRPSDMISMRGGAGGGGGGSLICLNLETF